MTRNRFSILLLGLLVLAGCARSQPNLLPAGEAAYATIPARADTADDEIIRAGDRLSIQVLGEPELTSDKYHVDSTGSIQMPLAGEVLSAGLRPSELRDELIRRLGSRFIRDPQVAVIIAERRKTSFAVEGAVEQPGVFEATPGTTLLSAVAQARSPTNTANLDQVMVFRTIGGNRMGARFNLVDIRQGTAPDPQIQAGDTIVVGHSQLKGAWREFLQTAPVFNLFYILR